MNTPTIVTRDEWLKARKAHLRNEKALTRMRDIVAAERRRLPWVKVEKDYVFDTTDGKRRLADLFGGNSQLIVHHFMFGPDWEAGCKSCSLVADHIEGAVIHLENHDVSVVRVSRAPLEKLTAYGRRLGWKTRWVSSLGSDFNIDFGVTATPEEMTRGTIPYNYDLIPHYGTEEMPGLSVFARNEGGEVFHTYSAYARGGEEVVAAFICLDMTPKGRNETVIMDWVRRNDEYARQATAAACCHTDAA